ncbi:MAG TPA: MOP flippase family protein [bacterium]|nr:MOP flippase family protein [bacterium]HPN93123.1 MOP flippase family protein [bacterium]
MDKLRNTAAKGVGYTGLSMVLTTVFLMLRTVILARILKPEDFGLMAIALVVMGFVDIFGQMGFHEAIIYKKNPTRNELSSLYIFSIGIGVSLFLAISFGAAAIENAYKMPGLKEILSVTSIAFIITPFGNQFKALAQKGLNFRILAISDVVAATANLVVAVCCAWIFRLGVWSLVWGTLSGSTIAAAIMMAYGWKNLNMPMLRFRFRDVSEYLNFGVYRALAMCANFLNARMDQLMIGWLMGPAAVGYYSMAYNLVIVPVTKLNPVITKVAFPLFAKVQEDALTLKKGYLRVVKIVSFVNSPILLGVAAVSPVALPFLLGEKWTQAVPILQILALVSFFRAVGNPVGSLILAKGRSDWSFYWNLALIPVTFVFIYFSAKSGNIIVVAWALVAMQAVAFPVSYMLLIRSLIGECFLEFSAASFFHLVGALPMAAAAAALPVAFPRMDTAIMLAAQIVLGAGVYYALARLVMREELNDMSKMFSVWSKRVAPK